MLSIGFFIVNKKVKRFLFYFQKTLDFDREMLYNIWVIYFAKGDNMAKQTGKQVTSNRKAYHDYFIEDTYEAGISLFGTEIKSIRAGQVNLKDSYCSVKDGEIFVVGMHISPYEKGNIFNREPLRDRKLLMHKREIMKLHGLVAQKGYSLIPLSLYFSGSRIKVQVGLCRGKKLYDKRDSDAKRDAQRTVEIYSKGGRDE